MDPLTLFALANGAVSAIKAGCKLYKDIKGAAGEIKDVLKDLDEQFHGAYAAKGKTPPPAAIKQLNEEKTRVKELNKQDSGDVYFELGQHLGAFFDNQAKCIAVFEAEEKRSYQVYTGEASVGARALQRVLMKKKLEQMEVDLRELLIYQSPPELGALWTEVLETSKVLNARQSIALKAQIEKHHREDIEHAKFMEKVYTWTWFIGGFIGILLLIFVMMVFVAEDRIKKYPQLGYELFPKNEKQRREEAEPKKYVGR
jgi:hypothetical protein